MSQQFKLSWRIGGPQGSGIDRITSLFAQAVALAGYQVSAHREYHSNIIGRHSYSDLCISRERPYSRNETTNVMVCLDAESLVRHAVTVMQGGFIVYDKKGADASLSSLTFLDQRLATEIVALTGVPGTETAISEILGKLVAREVTLVAVSFNDLLDEVASKTGLTRARARRAENTLAVAVSAAMLGLDKDYLLRAIDLTFARSKTAIELNYAAIDAAYRCAAELAGQQFFRDSRAAETDQDRLWLSGFQSVAMGKLAAGLGFQAYYPISPATDESTWLESACKALQQADTVEGLPLMIQAEDEIAALGMCCGAALTGTRASTATSGPGFSLMVEELGWAGMNETPVVITLYQRGGPSTGMPTRTEQGDLLFAVHAGHGESPRIVIASSDIESCYDDAIKAFEYAERFQVPVIHLLDKTLASTTRTVAPFKEPVLTQPESTLETAATGHAHVKRFTLPGNNGISPRPLIGNRGQAFWTTGVEHDEYGHVSEDPVIREQMMEKRARKLDYVNEVLSFDEKLAVSGDSDSGITIITWGSNKEPVIEATDLLQEKGIGIRSIQVRLLYPFPAEELASLIHDTDTLVAVECNESGQFSLLMRQYSGISPDYEILKYNGRAHTGQALYEAIHNIVNGQASDRRIVIRNPWE